MRTGKTIAATRRCAAARGGRAALWWVAWLHWQAAVAHAGVPEEVVGAEAAPVEPPRLLQQVALRYPPEAEGSGDVSVLVDVDAAGQVIAARFESGPEVFRVEALAAASNLQFAPATQAGVPVAATTRVWFHFAPPEVDPLLDEEGIEEVIIHARDPDREDTHARVSLDHEALERSAGDGLAESLARVPGVSAARGTADASKPIIRGQQERRLLVLFDGIRHESQKWGPDHATEIDPFAAGEIAVIRGAAGVRYGPDALGGVILVQPPPLRDERGVGGHALLSWASNGLRPYGAVRLDVVPDRAERLTLRAEGNYTRGASLSAPDYVLGNTASGVWNLGLVAGARWAGGQARVSWHHHSLRAGVFYGVGHSTPDEFEAQLTAARPVSADLWSTRFTIDRPYQQVSHDVVSLHLTQTGGWGTFEGTYAFQLNDRREYEQVRGSVSGAQYDFTLRTQTLDLAWQHPERVVGTATLAGTVGVQGLFQENVYRGLPLLPNHRGGAASLWAQERVAWRRADLEVGARYDHLSRAAFLDRQAYEAHRRRGTISEAMCTSDGDGARCPSRYDTGSLSLGGLAHLVPSALDLKVDLSSASRFPNTDELYLLGSAPTFPVYAVGDPGLRVETAWSGSLTLGLRLPWVEGEVSGYGSFIQRYIYFAPQIGPDGSRRYDVTIRGTWPSYAWRPIDAAVYGMDGALALGPKFVVGVEVGGALVRARDVDSGEHLIGTPPDSLQLALRVRPPLPRPLRSPELVVRADLVARQSRTDPAADFAPPPPGYALLGAGLSTGVAVGRRELRLGLDVYNLLNTRYREYVSLLRYYADNPGWDLRLRFGVESLTIALEAP